MICKRKEETSKMELLFQGRGDRTRTCDSLVPNQERYQLRYTPVNCATPRCTFSNADAKVQKFFDISKYFKEKSGNYISNYHFSLTCVKYN